MLDTGLKFYAAPSSPPQKPWGQGHRLRNFMFTMLISYQSVIRNHLYCNYKSLGGLLPIHNHWPKGSCLGVGLKVIFIKSSAAFLSFKLKLVGLTSVVLIVIILISLDDGQHDLYFMGSDFVSFLAHLSRRLTRWAYSIAMVRRPSVVVRRLSSVVVVVHTFKPVYLWSQLASLDQILCVASLEWGKGCIRFWGRLDQNPGFHGNRKPSLTYNGKNDVTTFSRCFWLDLFYTCR